MSNTFESGWQPKQKRVNPHDLLTPARVAALPRYRAPYLPHYRSTAKLAREGIKMRNYRVTEIPKLVNTAVRNVVIAEIGLVVFAEMLLCCYTAVPRYRVA
jgi:hypothetical protein